MSLEANWDDASSDEDYQYQEPEDTEADSADGTTDGGMDDDDLDDEYANLSSAFTNPGLAQQLLSQFSGTGIFATLNDAWNEWDQFGVEPDEEDYGIDELIHDGAFVMGSCTGAASRVRGS